MKVLAAFILKADAHRATESGSLCVPIKSLLRF
jgi:hypothetical protein